MRKRYITELEECKKLWSILFRPNNVSDLWEFRLCFQRHFNHRPYFLLLEDRKGIAGMVPLSYVKDQDMFVFFPAEIWANKTWIERTPIYSREQDFIPEILFSCPERTYLRYMEVPEGSVFPGLEVDELGYVLCPPTLGPDLALYRHRFPKKKFKAITKVVQLYNAPFSTFHFNRLEDFNLLVDMSLQHFGPDSYLHDDRFKEGFRDISYFLYNNGFLRMVSMEIKGKIVAVDLGALYGATYTVFLGGTHREFPGIAKAMNMHHIQFACNTGVSKVDFLCGDFHWKRLWHLDPEPLYKFVSPALRCENQIEHQQATISPDCQREGLPLA